MEMKFLGLGLFTLLIVSGCLAPSGEIKYDKVVDILNNPAVYKERTVNLNATVVYVMPYQNGSLLKLDDGTGEISATYTGDMELDEGDNAIFGGTILTDVFIWEMHTRGIILEISDIKDVRPSELEERPSVTPLQPVPVSPAIADVRANVGGFLQQTLVLSGKAVQSQDAGGYTYVEIDDGTGKMWVAIPETNISVGKDVEVEGFVMLDFPSRTLNKTFDMILFSAGITAMPSQPHGEATQPKVPAQINVTKAGGGYRISEIYENKESLNNKSVKVRAIAVKVSENIMDMTWIHIQDGTGNSSEKTNDLVVTYKGEQRISAGDEILVTGIVVINKDFGAGYIYKVVIESAEIEKL